MLIRSVESPKVFVPLGWAAVQAVGAWAPPYG